MKTPATPQVWLLALGFAVAGVLCISASLDLLRELGFQPTRRRAIAPAPPWVVTACGFTFLFGGLAMLLSHYRYRIAAKIAGLIATAGIVTAFLWIAFAR